MIRTRPPTIPTDSKLRRAGVGPTIIGPLVLLAFGCVTINLNFPEAEIREAADRIVEEVRPDISESENACRPSASASFFRTAYAAEKKKKLDADTTSPVVKRILATLKKRFKKLILYFRKGAIGEAYTGYLVLRDFKALSLKEQRDVKALVAAENKDRKNLYTEIAKLNGVKAAQLKQIAEIFSEKWQEKCEPGWWIQKKKKKKKWEKKTAKKKAKRKEKK